MDVLERIDFAWSGIFPYIIGFTGMFGGILNLVSAITADPKKRAWPASTALPVLIGK